MPIGTYPSNGVLTAVKEILDSVDGMTDEIRQEVYNCYHRRAWFERKAVINFLDAYTMDIPEGTHRYFALGSFHKDAKTSVAWAEVDSDWRNSSIANTVLDYTKGTTFEPWNSYFANWAYNAGSSVYTNGSGTNIEGAYILMDNMIASIQKEQNIPEENLYCFFISDGEPTAYATDPSSTAIDRVKGTSMPSNNHLYDETRLNNIASRVSDESYQVSVIWYGNATLDNSIYNLENGHTLYADNFSDVGTEEKISNLDISTEFISKAKKITRINPWTVDLSLDSARFSYDGVCSDSPSPASTVTLSDDKTELEWNLKQCTPTTLEDGRNYYQINYLATLDNTTEDFVEEQAYRTNSRAVLHYAVTENDIVTNLRNAEFDLPEVKGYLGDVIINKTDDSGAPLEGAVFKLKNDEIGAKTAVSAADGTVSFTSIPSARTYTLSEVSAPFGFLPDTTDHSVEIRYGVVTFDGVDDSLTVVNKSNGDIQKLSPDSVVIDYGIPVKISVVANDYVKDTGNLNAISASVTDGTELNNTAYSESRLVNPSQTVQLVHGTAQISGNQIIYQLNDMTINKEEVLYYEFLDSDGNYYYTTVTVIPATNIYYEDSFITFKDNGDYKWVTEGEPYTGKFQAEDRPGTFSLSEYDANNPYGSDSAYNDSSVTYSMGSVKSATVDAGSLGKEPTAEFTFCGTGFDLFSVTNAESGAMLVAVYNESGTRVKNYVVHTYYGYSYDEEEGKFLPNLESTDGLYQVPVIRARDFDYGTYKVVITPKYGKTFDMNYDENATDNSYKLYVDSVRIYDPAGKQPDPNSVVGEAYIQDHEYFPQYMEIRDNIISAETFYDSTAELDETQYTTGAVFIDGISSVDGNGISDKFLESGPNNEVYLAKGQAIAFHLTSNRAIEPGGSLALGMKVVGGATDGKLICMNSNELSPNTITICGGHEMFRSLDSCVEWELTDGTYKTKYPIILINSSDCIISLTNLKWAYATTEDEANNGLTLSVTSSTPKSALMAVRNFALSVNEFTPENVSAEWVSDSVYRYDSATLKITTDSDVDKVIADGKEITKFTTDENGCRVWIYKITAYNCGEKKVSLVFENSNGVQSAAIESPVLTVTKIPMSESIKSVEWVKSSVSLNSTAVLKITTGLNVTSVKINGVDTAEYVCMYQDGTEYSSGTKVWTYRFTASVSGRQAVTVTAYDSDNESSGNITSPVLTVNSRSSNNWLTAIFMKIVAFFGGLMK